MYIIAERLERLSQYFIVCVSSGFGIAIRYNKQNSIFSGSVFGSFGTLERMLTYVGTYLNNIFNKIIFYRMKFQLPKNIVPRGKCRCVYNFIISRYRMRD